MHFKFRNVNQAFNHLVNEIHEGGIITNVVPSRNGEVIRIEEPVIITYHRPWERVLFNESRDCNPFFHLVECLWMIAGSDKVAPLDYYNSNMKTYSDDGVTFWGAYGYRWRTWFGRDQLESIIEELKRNPYSRRVVLSMWDGALDHSKAVKGGKDVPCLAGEVKIRSPEGNTTIKKLAQAFQGDNNYKFPVYTVDVTTGDQRLGWMTNAWKSGVKQTYKVRFDDGSSLRMTGDHRVFRKKKIYEGTRCVGMSREEVMVCDLKVGDRLVSALSNDAKSRTNYKGYKQFKRNLYKNTVGSNMVSEHREYVSMFEPLKKNHSIHHTNNNPTDNRIANLVQLPNSIHYGIDKDGPSNPHCKMSDQAREARGEKHSASLQRHWASMDGETRKAYAQRKKFRTPRQWELIEEHRSKKSNHRVVSIEKDKIVPVYDFTVAERHTAVADNGVVLHNCNTHAYFELEDEKYLNMTVCNRSNDLVWGSLGANVVHFSFLQEYLATAIGVECGSYHQMTNNLHAYSDKWEPEKWLAEDLVDHYVEQDIEHTPVVQDPMLFYSECKKFVNSGINGVYLEPFIKHTVLPMCQAFHAHKELRNYDTAQAIMLGVEAPDWRHAGQTWLYKRQRIWEKKNA